MSHSGECGLFESRHSVKNKKLFHQTVKELFVVRVSFKGFKKLQMQKRYSDVGNQYFTFFMQEKSFGEFLA